MTPPIDPWSIFSFVHKQENGCWNSKYATDPSGHCSTFIRGKREYIHRIAYQLYYGVILPKATRYNGFILHKCHNGRCINPKHLYLGDRRSNYMDAVANGNHLFMRGKHRGSKNDAAKLNEVKVKEIKYLLQQPAYKIPFGDNRIAELYNVSVSAIQKIKHNRTWTHVK